MPNWLGIPEGQTTLNINLNTNAVYAVFWIGLTVVLALAAQNCDQDKGY